MLEKKTQPLHLSHYLLYVVLNQIKMIPHNLIFLFHRHYMKGGFAKAENYDFT